MRPHLTNLIRLALGLLTPIEAARAEGGAGVARKTVYVVSLCTLAKAFMLPKIKFFLGYI